MNITEALDILRSARSIPGLFELQLACSFSPVHLKTLLSAQLQKCIPERRVNVAEGTFGDLAGVIERCDSASLGEITSAAESSVAAWDSIGAITLLNVIEDEFAITMDLELAAELDSFPKIHEYLKTAAVNA